MLHINVTSVMIKGRFKDGGEELPVISLVIPGFIQPFCPLYLVLVDIFSTLLHSAAHADISEK